MCILVDILMGVGEILMPHFLKKATWLAPLYS